MYRVLPKTKFLKPHKSTEGKIEWEFNNVSLFFFLLHQLFYKKLQEENYK